MHPFTVTVRFPNIEPGNLVEFKQTAAEVLAISRQEPGTLRYDYFLNAAETTCVVLEVFANSAACLAHLVGVGARLGRLMILGGGMEIECFGNPSPELVAATAPLSPVIYSLLDGKQVPETRMPA